MPGVHWGVSPQIDSQACGGLQRSRASVRRPAIEGAKLTDREVERLLSNLRIGSFASRDEQEVAGYAAVMETIFAAFDSIPLNENHIRQLHRDLLAHSTKDERHRGNWKTLSNNVEAFDEDGRSLGIVFETASPCDTPGRMADLVAWQQAQEKDGTFHSLLIAAVFVVVFWKSIHSRTAMAACRGL